MGNYLLPLNVWRYSWGVALTEVIKAEFNCVCQELIRVDNIIFFATWTMHSYTVNKRPTDASKYPRISILPHSYIFRCIRGAILREFSMSLLNCCPMSWKRNGMSAVYCDFLRSRMVAIYSPHPVPLSWHWATIQQIHIELPEDGAYDAPKHVGER
jgi:uncharacterized membrane protein YecN with MAPEG domain